MLSLSKIVQKKSSYQAKALHTFKYKFIVSGSTYSLVLPLLYINPNQSLGKRAIEKLKNIERNSKVDFVKNYGFEANWKNNLYLANGHCVK